MRYAIFSDIHSNIEAFESVLKAIELEGVDRRIFLGDIVGYGANPNQCIRLLQESADIVLAGNHDYGVIGRTDITNFNEYAKEAILWTREVLSDENKDYLKGLPVIYQYDSITFAHSSPWEPAKWHYVLNMNDAIKNFGHYDTQLCFIGHSHNPVTVEQSPGLDFKVIRKTDYNLKDKYKYIVNDGSVGQPRDGNNNAAFCIYDSAKNNIEVKRVEYDIESQQTTMRKHGLPDYLIDRIAYGR